jgi:uncharacterized iron-regulated membrane protein
MLVSGISGLLLWLLAKPDLRTVFQIPLRFSKRTPLEVHRLAGLGAACLLGLEAFTGLWLCFPQTMRGMLATAVPISADVRPARAPRNAASSTEPKARAGLGELIAAAHDAIPDGSIEEIRMPEGNGDVQIRMWRPGDFRSLGNNVVFLSGSTAQVRVVDRYADRPAANRFLQAMAGLHYDEWGGLPFRLAACAAGLATPLLFVTGILIWWYSRRRKHPSVLRQTHTDGVAALTS